MKTLYLDCFAGVSGDMLMGALLDFGVSVETLSEHLAGLSLNGYRLTSDKTVKVGITATQATVELVDTSHAHRHLPDILDIINKSNLSPAVKEKSIKVFYTLAVAEGKIHGLPPEKVHFHEVGAVDAIIDIVGTITLLDILGIEKIVCSKLPLGSGYVQCAHGLLPLPAPATLEILRGVPVVSCDINGETVTPTGAALVKTLSSEFGPMPTIEVHAIGYGAGLADRKIPNILRAVLGKTTTPRPGFESLGKAFHEDNLNIIETNIDNMNPEFYEHIMSLLLASGAVDVYVTPIIMKKGRPGQILSCLVPMYSQDTIINLLLRETSSLGVRLYPCERYKLDREIISVPTAYGFISVKVARHPGTGSLMNVAPEWEDCKAVALKHNAPVKIVYDLAKAEAYKAVKPQ